MPLLDACIAEVVGYARVKGRDGGVDGCGLQACRKSDLRLFVTDSQIHVSYACRDERVRDVPIVGLPATSPWPRRV